MRLRIMARRTKSWCMVVTAIVMAVPQFALRDTEGTVHLQDDWSKATAIVIFFTTTDCPLSNGYVPEMNRVRKDYSGRGVAFYAVQTDTTIAEAEVRRHAREFGFSFPVLLDPQQFLVRLTGATATPEVAVLSRSGKVLYLGRIDRVLRREHSGGRTQSLHIAACRSLRRDSPENPYRRPQLRLSAAESTL
jgi:peroxiredoxin